MVGSTPAGRAARMVSNRTMRVTSSRPVPAPPRPVPPVCLGKNGGAATPRPPFRRLAASDGWTGRPLPFGWLLGRAPSWSHRVVALIVVLALVTSPAAAQPPSDSPAASTDVAPGRLQRPDLELI